MKTCNTECTFFENFLQRKCHSYDHGSHDSLSHRVGGLGFSVVSVNWVKSLRFHLFWGCFYLCFFLFVYFQEYLLLFLSYSEYLVNADGHQWKAMFVK